MGWFDDPTGLIAFSLIVAALATVPISRAILARYRQRIGALMREGRAAGAEPAVDRPGACGELRFAREPSAARPAVLTAGGGAALVHALAGLAWAGVATLFTFLLNELEPSPGRVVAVGSVFLWPVAPLVARTGAWGRRAELLAPASLLGIALLVGVLMGGGVAHAVGVAWAVAMLPPTATFLLVSWLGSPAVGPWVAGFLAVWVLGTYVGLASIVSLGTAPDAVVLLLVATALISAALRGHAMVRWVARRALVGKVSDAMLAADVWWTVFTAWLCIWLSIPGATPAAKWWGVLAGASAFAAYRVVLAVGLRCLGATSPGPRLLLLRVFGHRGRAERLLDEVGRRWRRKGSIQLIAAPDVAAATLDPHELLDFLAGRLGRAFVRDAASLEARLADVALDPDADGSHRVTEFLCRNDQWRRTLQRLAEDASAVLMDLRGFGPENSGCIYELGQLLDLVATDRIVLVVDESTQVDFLEATLRDAWSKLRADSPNRSAAAGPLRVVDTGAPGSDPAAKILATLEEVAWLTP